MPPPGPAGYDLRLAAARFHRMLVTIGTISVLAPTQMTLIEDTPRERPNLYDGLPRELKVKYLMSTLTPAQWKTLGEQGLGLGDLTGEQQPVYRSLLPDPFVVTRIPLRVKAGDDDRHTYSTLTPEQRAQVRLRVQRAALVMVPTQGNPNSFMLAYDGDGRSVGTIGTPGPPGPPSNALWERNTQADAEKTDLFGVNLSSIVPNKPKLSQLEYASARLDPSVALDGAATLGDLMARIRDVTGVGVFADGRAAHLPLLTRGARARSGDVLKALALAVTGTYRKVDTAFVLTSDLTGIGTRQLRLATWEWQIKAQTRLLEKELMRQIIQHSGANGGVRALGYAPDDPYPLTPALEQQILQNQQAMKSPDIPAAALTPALQQLLRDAAADNERMFPTGPRMRDDAARIGVLWNFRFQTPDGVILPAEQGMVGSSLDFYPRSAAPSPVSGAAAGAKPFVPRPLRGASAPHTLFLTPRSPQEAIVMTSEAQRLGFTDLVLYTSDRAALSAAIAQAGKMRGQAAGAARPLRICAAVAPFAVEAGSGAGRSGQDVNVLGETSAQMAQARSLHPLWNDLLQNQVESAFPRLVLERVAGGANALPPLGVDMAARFGMIAELARVPGLAGLFLYDTQPSGYAGREPVYEATETKILRERANLGYVPALRAAFLRRFGADPLDLIPPGLYVGANLFLPFFPDRVAAPHALIAREQFVADFTQQKNREWDQFRGDRNRRAMADLFGLLRASAPALPLMAEARAERNDEADAYHLWPAWVSWTQPDALPIGTALLHSDKRPALPDGGRYLFPVQLSASDLLPAQDRLRQALDILQRAGASGKPASFALDCRFLPASRALTLLDASIAPAMQAQ